MKVFTEDSWEKNLLSKSGFRLVTYRIPEEVQNPDRLKNLLAFFEILLLYLYLSYGYNITLNITSSEF